MTDSKPGTSLLQVFSELLEQVPIDFIDAALKYSEDEDHKAIIHSFAPSLKNQFKEISLHMREISATAPRQRLAEAEKLLKMTSGILLVQNLKLALPSIGSIIGKLGIAGIIEEIKKIIKFLLRLLHINLPGWVDELLVIIDQIINHIMGGGSVKMMTALSQKEQNYLAELTQFAKLQYATKELNDHQEED